MADATDLTPETAATEAAPAPAVADPAPAASDLPVVVSADSAPTPVAAKPVRKARKAKPAVAKAPAPVAKVPAVKAAKAKAPAAKPVVVKAAAAKKAPSKTATPAIVSPKVVASKPARKRLSTPPQKAAPVSRSLPASKDKTMAKQAFDFTTALKTAFADIQDKAKTTYEKSSAALTEVNEFTKGNVEAVVESGKILASGLQEMGSTAVADSRAAFESLTAEAKTFATATSPTAFFELQSTLMRKHFDVAVSQTSKNAEAMLKLVSESFAPISNRVAIAVEKVSKAA